MPAPVSTDDLLTNLRKSGLVNDAQMTAALADAPYGETPSAFLDRLIGLNLVTPYQAEKLAVGKYKGFVLGPYIIQDRIGGGGMGHVFLAEHSAMRRSVALKVLTVVSANDAVARERFFREARVAAGLNHPNIVRVFDLRREDAIIYLVMEYVEGDSLQHIIARHGALPWATATDYARQVALGLQHAHETGLVHRDIKPGNLLLSPDGTVRIIDLGLVRWEAEADSKLTEKVDRSILGTADYLAPEQAVNSSKVDIRADIYSLGATLYFLLAGRTIFPDGKTAQKLMWQQMKAPTPIRDLVPEIPAELGAIIGKCLSKKPDERYTTPAELADALLAFCPPMPQLPEPGWFTKKSRGSSITKLPETRSTAKRPGLESTMLPPLSSGVAKSSHLFRSTMPTVSDSMDETPRRWPLPEPRQSKTPAATPPPPAKKPVSPLVWVTIGIVLAVAVMGGVMVLMK